MTKTVRLELTLFLGLLTVALYVGSLAAQGNEQEQPWNAEVRRALTDAVRQLRATSAEQNWADAVQTAIAEAEKRLKATPSGLVRAEEIQNALADAAKSLREVTATGTARDEQIRAILSEASAILQGVAEPKSAGSGQGEHETAASLQMNAPNITPIKGGYYVQFDSLTEIGAVRLGGPMTGKYEIFFDQRLEDIDTAPQPTDSPDLLMVLADYWIVRGKPENAVPLYELGLEKDPNNFLFLNNLALLVSDAVKDHDKALRIIDGALKERADNVTLLDTKGLILINANRSDEAIPVLQRAVELSCQKPLCVMHYAYALDMQGQTAPARDWFNQVLPLLETSVDTFLKNDKAMFDYLKMTYAGPSL